MKRIYLSIISIATLFTAGHGQANSLAQAYKLIQQNPAETVAGVAAIVTAGQHIRNWYLTQTGTTVTSLQNNPGKEIRFESYVPALCIPGKIRAIKKQIEEAIIKPSSNAHYLVIQEHKTVDQHGAITVTLSVCQKSVWDGWNLSETGTTIKGRFYTKHALERMAPATKEVLEELERRALQHGYPKGSTKFNNYIKPRGIPPSIVEVVINSTPATKKNAVIIHELDNIRVVLGLDGEVITVIEKQ